MAGISLGFSFLSISGYVVKRAVDIAKLTFFIVFLVHQMSTRSDSTASKCESSRLGVWIFGIYD